jgi:thioredoxin reductase
MPRKMRLKSEGFASSLYDPGCQFTLRDYCEEHGLPYADTGNPVPLETFVSYGLAFQKKFVPNLEEKLIVSLSQCPAGFALRLEDGERVLARKVVVAVGITHFGHVPEVLRALPKEFVSHSSAHSNLEGFRDRQITVVGAGASALDLAALLHQAGASVQVIARASSIRFHDPPQPRSLAEKLLRPATGIGPGMKLFFYVHAPLIFRQMPEAFRLEKVRETLGPAPPWFVKEQVVGKVPLHVGVEITGASIQNHKARLQLTDGKGNQQTVDADHIISATGYQVDLERLEFLDSEVREKVRTAGKAPALSANFESSVPGLYFVGVTAANTFGPLMRFAFGAKVTARRISKHLAKSVHGKSIFHRTAKAQVFEDDGATRQI